MGGWATETRFEGSNINICLLQKYFNLLGIYAEMELHVGNPNMVMALAGNKADLEDRRKVSADVSFYFIYLVVYNF
jgi:hypothetical protein